MHKKLLAVAVTSTLLAMGAAQAQNVSGTGDVLIGSIYSTEAGQDTYINIVNTTEDAKAVKVRFREGRGSEDSLDFHVYLSPSDMWAAAVTKNSAGEVVVVTQDTSCTVPFISANPETTGAKMRTTYIPAVFEGDAEARVREGYVEIIEMASFGDDTSRPDDYDDDDEAADALSTWDPEEELDPQLIAWASKHVGGVPRACGAINDFNGADHSPETDSTALFLAPTSGLFGNMGLINVQQGTYVPFEMDAFLTFNDGAIFFSQNATEGDGSLLGYTLDEGLIFEKTVVGGAGDLQHFDLPDLSTVAQPLGFLMIDRLFDLNDQMNSTAVVSEYVVDTSIGASTDWVLTFPTKRFHSNGAYVFDLEGQAPLPVGTQLGDPLNDAIPPFSRAFNQRTGAACEPIRLSYFDREERTPVTPPGGPDFSPGRPDVAPGVNLCFEMNVVSFNDPDLDSPSRVVGGVTTRQNLNVIYQSGWGRIDFRNTAGARDYGLPVLGFSAYNLVNNNVAGGVLANYGGAFANRYVLGEGNNDLLLP